MTTEHAFRFAPEYGQFGFSDHWPMERHARLSLGAANDALAPFEAAATGRLDPLPEPAPDLDVSAQFDTGLGQRQAYANYLDLFDQSVKQIGVQATLDLYWPALEPGLGSAAFHGIIRLAFGLETGTESEIAAGLAYMASAFFDPGLGGAAPAKSRIQAADDMQAWFQHPACRAFAHHRLISSRIAAAVHQPALRESFLSNGLPEGQGLADVRRFALDLYLATADFSALHGVTGTHAVRVIAGHTQVSRDLPARLWSNLLAIYLVIGAPELAPMAAPADRSWPDLFEAAIASPDAHDVKLVYSAHAEWEETGEERYRQAANLRLGPITGT